MTDCLIIGYNNMRFDGYVDAVRRMGTDHVSFRVLNSSFIEFEGRVYPCMEILNRFFHEGRPGPAKPMHSFDFLQPVITYLGTFLQRRGLSFDYVNMFQLEQDALREKLLAGEVLTVAVTTTFYETPDPIIEIIEFVRRYNRSAKIVVGGPHVAYQTKIMEPAAQQYLFKQIGADFYVINSEGETALVRLLEALKEGGDLDAIDNIAYRRGDRYVVTASAPESNPLEENLVDYRLFPPQELSQFVSLRTAKSCPFRCSFCDFPGMAGKYRYTGVEVVERELDALRDLGFVTTLTFIDDTFNVPKKRFKEILRMMIRNRYPFRWNCFYRADHGDEECIDLMAEAGCEGVFMGVESGSDQMLQVMNKTARQKDYRAAIPRLKEVGILTYASLIIGFPGETYDTVQESIDFLEQLQPDFFQPNIWYCHPATPIFQRKEELGIRGSAYNWSHNTMDSRTAADLVEKVVLSVAGSTWLPYYFWNVFYLQRLGMTLEQMKGFIRSFNGLVAEKLVDPRRTADGSALLDGVRRCCQFDREHPEAPPVEVLVGERYRGAERYWVEEFRDPPPAPAPGGEAAAAEAEALAPAAVDGGSWARLAAAYRAPPPVVATAALGVLVAEQVGHGDVTLLAALDGAGDRVLPLRFEVDPQASFAELVAEVRRRIDAAGPHAASGLHFVTNRERLRQHGSSVPSFSAAFVWLEGGERPARDPLAAVTTAWPALAADLGLCLTARDLEGRVDLAGWRRGPAFAAAPPGPRLAALLTRAAERPAVRVGELGGAAAAAWQRRGPAAGAAAGAVSPEVGHG